LFLISLKAGGVGQNLAEADYVIHLDRYGIQRSRISAANPTIRSIMRTPDASREVRAILKRRKKKANRDRAEEKKPAVNVAGC